MRLTLLTLALLANGCEDRAIGVPGGRWIGEKLEEKPAVPTPLGLDDAAPSPVRVGDQIPPPAVPRPRLQPEPPGAKTRPPAPSPSAAKPRSEASSTVPGLTQVKLTTATNADTATLVAHVETMLAARKLRQALISAKKAELKRPRDPDLPALVGRVYATSGNHYAAADAFRRTLRLDADHEGALYGLAVAQSATQQYDRAAQTLARLRKLRRNDARLDQLEAVLRAKRGDRGGTVSALRDAAGKSPKDPEALIRLGNALARDGKYGEAARALRKAAAKRPSDGELQLQLGTALGLAGRQAEAESALSRAARLTNGREAWSNLATVREQIGDLGGAVAALKRLRSLLPPPRRPALDDRITRLQATMEAEKKKAESSTRPPSR